MRSWCTVGGKFGAGVNRVELHVHATCEGRGGEGREETSLFCLLFPTQVVPIEAITLLLSRATATGSYLMTT